MDPLSTNLSSSSSTEEHQDGKEPTNVDKDTLGDSQEALEPVSTQKDATGPTQFKASPGITVIDAYRGRRSEDEPSEINEASGPASPCCATHRALRQHASSQDACIVISDAQKVCLFIIG